MLIISYDAVGDSEFERLMEYPNFSAFSKQAAAFREVRTLFLSNTYPIHTSIATGVMPGVHGVTSNTEPFPKKHPRWNSEEARIRVKTLWQAAAEKGIKTAAVFWPVTAFSKTVRYNIPEVLARPGKSQVMASLKAGSKYLQLHMVLRHGKKLEGIEQPCLDNFAASCMADILREHRPGLALIHLTAYDALCHKHGKDSEALSIALESLDTNLALLLEAAGEERDVLLFSDHSQLNIDAELQPNDVLVGAGHMRKENGAYLAGDSGCYFECCGGSAFFHAGSLPALQVEELRRSIKQSEGFRRFLTQDEMSEAGFESAAFGFCAKKGYGYAAFPHGHKAEHGYPTDMPDYNVFYLARGFELDPGATTRGGSLLDITPIVAQRLGLEL